MTAKSYFVSVFIVTLFLLGLILSQQPAWLQWSKETLFGFPKLQAQQDSFYQQRVDPIFARYCTECHQKDKVKGQLRLDSYRQTLFGGRSGELLSTNGRMSVLLERMQLPADHRLAMPPYGRKRHTEAELEIIKLWLAKGASGQLTEADFPEAPKAKRYIDFEPYQPEQVAALRSNHAAEVAQLQVKYPFNVQYVARTSHYLEIIHLSSAPVADSLFLQLGPVANIVQKLNLRNAAVSDQAVISWLQMPSLTYINIAATQLSAEAVTKLLSLGNLKQLVINKSLLVHIPIKKFEQAGIQVRGIEGG
ncbi:c-type cytochrome domain-containing protein [Gayadomonas joobiniege]|uniref:c-type cytochrome domain-containing protein n=1 Tax=Gayadomonas joobiniege TaxID=1234606 RepID=UPI00037EA1FB|nr:c-type cytochrome domain-containing protein [Gayadomonas joobiniege]